MCISQILEYLVFIQNTETGVLLGRACIKYKYKCIEKIYIAERKKICIPVLYDKQMEMIYSGFHYKYHKLYHFLQHMKKKRNLCLN